MKIIALAETHTKNRKTEKTNYKLTQQTLLTNVR